MAKKIKKVILNVLFVKSLKTTNFKLSIFINYFKKSNNGMPTVPLGLVSPVRRNVNNIHALMNNQI